MNIGPLIRTVGEPYSAPPMESILGGPADAPACLLELRTDSGLLYVQPTGWQRLRLRWTFRHFNVLPPQLLSRSDQRMIENLSRSALVTPSLPVPRSTVLGVVENLRTKSDRTVVFTQEPPRSMAPQARLHIVHDVERPIERDVEHAIEHAIEHDDVRDSRFPQWWGVVAIVLAVGLIIYSVFRATTHARKSPAVSLPAVHAAPPMQPAVKLDIPRNVSPEPTLVSRVAAPAGHLRKAVTEAVIGPGAAAMPAPDPAPAPAASIAPATSAPRFFISELPQGHLVQPVLLDPKLTGQLDLRAFIAADGSVKEVTLVSGDPKLAEAAIRAINRWRYSPSQTAGFQGEGETLIRMNFFGRDAVSITSVAR